MKFMDVRAVDGVLKMAKIARGTDYFGVKIPEERAFKLLDRYLELGGNVIDTARVYGRARASDDEYSNSEPIVGRWIQSRGCRDRIVLLTKGCHPVMEDPSRRRVNKACIDEDIATSLREMNVERIDAYLLHRDDPSVPVSEIIDALHTHIKAGELRAIGTSNWTCARINEANAYAARAGKTPFTLSQIQWGIAYLKPNARPDPTLLGMNETEYAGYLENKIPVMAYSPQAGGYFSKILEGGALQQKFVERYDGAENRRRLEAVRRVCEQTGKSAAAVGLAYITSDRLSGCAVIGSSTIEQLEDSMSDCDLTLDQETCDALVK